MAFGHWSQHATLCMVIANAFSMGGELAGLRDFLPGRYRAILDAESAATERVDGEITVKDLKAILGVK